MTAQEPELLVDFGHAGNSRLFCGSGWSAPEPGERWTSGRESHLVIAAPATPGSYYLLLQLRPFVAPGLLGGQRLIVTVNGRQLGEFSLKEPTTLGYYLPWPAIADQKRLVIGFGMPDAASPASLGADSDRRVLAVAFRSLALCRDRYAPPDPASTGGGVWRRAADQGLSEEDARLTPRDLMLQFESLGENCEFGLVQRRCDAEPLGLLRFASTPLRHLLGALAGGFVGLGEPDAISIVPSGNEYMVSDERYGVLYHAWVKIGEMSPDDIHRREVRRLPILVRKLLQDLRGSQKAFIFRGMGALAEDEVVPLVAALRRFGPNVLLFVTLADAARPSGTVELRFPGFLVGYIERFAPGEDAHDLLLDDWMALCRNAHALRAAIDRATGPLR